MKKCASFALHQRTFNRNEVNVRNMGRVFVKSQSMFNMREC